MHKHKKKLGQHFIHDKNLINKIVRYIAPMSSDEIIEIGPGDGALSYITVSYTHLTAADE